MTEQGKLPNRLASVDAYRGFVMLLILAEALRLPSVARATGSGFWKFLGYHQSHVEWLGCSLHDLIQPSFSFLVGVALPFSIASRKARGQSALAMTGHAWWRAFVLVALGVFLRSVGRPQTYFTFQDTLAQIGLGYGLLFLLGLRPVREQWIALAVILVGIWGAFAWYPLPTADFDYAKVGVSADWWQAHGLSGFAAHWNKNSNLAWAFDAWFLNLFPRQQPFTYEGGGYATLSFIPTLGTMILGLLAGGVLRDERPLRARLRWLVIAGAVAMAAGWLLGALGVCPVVKRIWTPSWVLFSGGWCFLLLAAFYVAVDVAGKRAWAFPLIVVGMNSIAAYCMDALIMGFLREAWPRHVGAGVFKVFGPGYEPLLLGAIVVATAWLILYWMYRRKIFLRI